MKTTIDLPDALANEAKRFAATQHTTLRDLVVSGLRAELARRQERPAADFHFPTVDGHGLSAGLTPAEAIARSYDLPA